jgi:hypothetical protein
MDVGLLAWIGTLLEVVNCCLELTIEAWRVERWEVKGRVIREHPVRRDPVLYGEIYRWHPARLSILSSLWPSTRVRVKEK